MKKTTCIINIQRQARLGAGLLFVLAGLGSSAWAYKYYSDPVTGAGMCLTCHGDFRGATSTKGTVFPGGQNHYMHRNSAAMGTACNLCHGSVDNFPVAIASSAGTGNNPGLGCGGCHEPLGLRKHHLSNGVTGCQGCHPTDGTPPGETVKPRYYNTADTKARNPANELLLSNTNENWSLGDFLGLDNDGDNHYDLADYEVGPFRILSTTVQGNNLVVTWLTAGGRTNTVQKSSDLSTPFTDLSSAIEIPGVGLRTNSYVDVGGAANGSRYHRLKGTTP